jgi:hypothetical protein
MPKRDRGQIRWIFVAGIIAARRVAALYAATLCAATDSDRLLATPTRARLDLRCSKSLPDAVGANKDHADEAHRPRDARQSS